MLKKNKELEEEYILKKYQKKTKLLDCFLIASSFYVIHYLINKTLFLINLILLVIHDKKTEIEKETIKRINTFIELEIVSALICFSKIISTIMWIKYKDKLIFERQVKKVATILDKFSVLIRINNSNKNKEHAKIKGESYQMLQSISCVYLKNCSPSARRKNRIISTMIESVDRFLSLL